MTAPPRVERIPSAYGFYDIAALLLNEYDRRMQTDLRRRYCEALNTRQLSPRFLNVLRSTKLSSSVPRNFAAPAVAGTPG
jgi:hypothetical protein